MISIENIMGSTLKEKNLLQREKIPMGVYSKGKTLLLRVQVLFFKS